MCLRLNFKGFGGVIRNCSKSEKLFMTILKQLLRCKKSCKEKHLSKVLFKELICFLLCALSFRMWKTKLDFEYGDT